MPIQVSKPRHIVEKTDNLVRVTLPSQRNIFLVLFACLVVLMWGYLVYALVRIAVAAYQIIEIGKNSTPPVQPGSAFSFIPIFFFFFLLVTLGFGIFSIYRLCWLIAGKEVIEANPQTLRITKQIFQWKRSKEYPSEKVNDLRPNTQPLSTLFFPGKRVKKFLGGAGMIAFDYGERTFSFGQDVDEAEARQIILAIQKGLPQQRAG
jgi:hypothetical protein